MKRILFYFMAVLAFLSGTAVLSAEATGLSPQQRSMVSIASGVSTGRLDQVKLALEQGLDAGLTVNQIGEILLQSYAYSGFPRSLNGMTVFRGLLQERQAKGIKDVFGQEPSPPQTTIPAYIVGRDNINLLTGSKASQGRPDSLGFEATMDVFLKEHLFADIIGRDNLSFSSRELVTVSILSSMERVNPQLMSHMNGAMNLGVNETQLRELVSIIDAWTGPAQARNAAQVLDQVMTGRKNQAVSNAAASPASTAALTYVPEVFAKGQRMQNEHFSGSFWLGAVIPDQSPVSVPVLNVTFEPGTRNNWHAHPGGQILLVTLGQGYYQEWGKPARKLKDGDVVTIGPNIKHWHGAAKTSWFAHLAIDPAPASGPVQWMERVNDSDYNALEQGK